ncbi:M20/M25/M40 family metallo-hydrolase [Pyxidicoccus fallax]|uniref:M20/M25/M40 family metallo-hydrolase n=1 Tax=Pyxidicoccus fallax TaxID=394095 RepID=A0A848LKJ9_9BACT|nr:M20/M25/M40 family metallo-hydrolase [Pyxidicoccus fallax]NMO18248.1 M20/M25/M40 family metallo-hydrolase [Pyxidicoccus fallax]NPC79994.1 M20/M25/M40 family metallo-hydrolase [Pyxidicoccus fallax]
MKKLLPLSLMLLSTTPAFAEQKKPVAPDREVWVSIGADAVAPMRESFKSVGWEEPTAIAAKDSATVFRLRESQLGRLATLMHERFHRCAGFITFDTKEEAIAALEPAPAVAPQNLVTYTLDNAATVNTLMGAATEANVRSTITSLSSYTTRYYTSQTGVDAANWLRTRWQSFVPSTRTDVTVELYRHTGWAQPSVILTIRGTTLPNEVVVVGGHLDSINQSGTAAPGADDDASGVASFTEVIRVAMARNYRPQRTVKFMAYAAEEVGLRGSREIAAYHKNNGINVVGVLQLDMTNYKGSASYDVGIVTDNTNAAQNTFLRNLITTYVKIPHTNTSCGYGCSDHASWTGQGFAASIPFEATVSAGSPYIHTSGDTLARSGGTANHALKFTKIAAAYVAELAKGTAQ